MHHFSSQQLQMYSDDDTIEIRSPAADLKTAAKRSATEAGVRESEDCKRHNIFSQGTSLMSAEADTVHIELLSDDENALYDV